MLNQLVEYVAQNGGATVNPSNGTMPVDGFMCAIAQNEYVMDGQVTANALTTYIEQYAHDLEKDGAFLGIWYNTENDKTYLDTSFRFENVDDALEFAKVNEQLAIFDLATFNEIRL